MSLRLEILNSLFEKEEGDSFSMSTTMLLLVNKRKKYVKK